MHDLASLAAPFPFKLAPAGLFFHTGIEWAKAKGAILIWKVAGIPLAVHPSHLIHASKALLRAETSL
jgi:hypothetical protein